VEIIASFPVSALRGLTCPTHNEHIRLRAPARARLRVVRRQPPPDGTAL